MGGMSIFFVPEDTLALAAVTPEDGILRVKGAFWEVKKVTHSLNTFRSWV
jgi:hypothetical protein